MPLHTIAADELTIGDVITSTPAPITVRDIKRAPGGVVTVNPDATDEATGHVWNEVTVERP